MSPWLHSKSNICCPGGTLCHSRQTAISNIIVAIFLYACALCLFGVPFTVLTIFSQCRKYLLRLVDISKYVPDSCRTDGYYHLMSESHKLIFINILCEYVVIFVYYGWLVTSGLDCAVSHETFLMQRYQEDFDGSIGTLILTKEIYCAIWYDWLKLYQNSSPMC